MRGESPGEAIVGTPGEVIEETTLVLLAGGRGTRFGATPDQLKHLQSVAGVPLIVRLLQQFGPAFREPPVIVVNESDRQTGEVVRRWGCETRTIDQTGPRGTLPAMMTAVPLCAREALFVLADLVFEGRFDPAPFHVPNVGVWHEAPPAAVTANFGVRCRNHDVIHVVEKPPIPADQACGLGVYHVPIKMLTGFAGLVPVDAKGERGVTDLLSALVADGIGVQCRSFRGRYWNVNRGLDLAEARACLEGSAR